MSTSTDLTKFYLNAERMHYLLELFQIEVNAFLKLVQGNNKNPVITKDEFDSYLKKDKSIELKKLKKIDKVFGKGPLWYVSRRPLPEKQDMSILFRKDSFNAELNLASRKKVEELEKRKIETEILCNNLDFNYAKKMSFNIDNDPRVAAQEVRKQFEENILLLQQKNLFKSGNTDRSFLENLVRLIEVNNVFVIEILDRKRNPENKINFNGLFMRPNFIVIKRQSRYLKREIFTLLHEFAHYLIDKEEIDENTDVFNGQSLNRNIEAWCNDFAYFYLIGEYANQIETLPLASKANDFYEELFEEISSKNKISSFAIYTRLKKIGKISDDAYYNIQSEIKSNVEMNAQKQIELAKKKALEQGKKPYFSQPQLIQSNLYKEIIKLNYFGGNISEKRALESLNAKNKRIEEVIYS